MRAQRLLQSMLIVAIPITAAILTPTTAQAQSAKKPNILVIMGDDIGIYNLSAYHQGMMGYDTPNIDRLARLDALRSSPANFLFVQA